MNQGQDWKYRQDHDVSWPSFANGRIRNDGCLAPISSNDFDRQQQPAEGRNGGDQLNGAIAMDVVGMPQHLDDDHNEQSSDSDACDETCQLFDVGYLHPAEWLEEGNDCEHADKRPARQNQKMRGEDAHRPEPPGLIRVRINVGETDICDQGAGGDSDVAASRDDGHRRPDERGNFQPRAPILDAQQ
jgi:hypothetical protein